MSKDNFKVKVECDNNNGCIRILKGNSKSVIRYQERKSMAINEKTNLKLNQVIS